MARSNRSRRQVRVTSANARRVQRLDLSLLDRLKPVVRPSVVGPLFEDQRRFVPASSRRVTSTVRGRPAAVRRLGMSQRLEFVAPARVVTCVRRKIRRQVMFARGGAGSRRMRRPRYNSRSTIRC